MEAKINVHTELRKIAQILDVPDEQVTFLEHLTPDNLQFLRVKVNEAIQTEQSPAWARLAKVIKFFPNRLNAKLAEEFIGPHISANLTYHISVKEAVNLAKYFSIPFLGEISTHLIPEKSQEMLNNFPMKLIEKIMDHLLEKKEYLTLGNFIDYIAKDRVLALAPRINSAEVMLNIAFLAQRKDYLAEIALEFSDDKIKDLLEAAYRLSLWEEIFLIVEYFPKDQMDRVGKLASSMGAEVIGAAMDYLIANDGYETMGVFVDYMDTDVVVTMADRITSPETMLRIATFSQKKENLAQIVMAFPDEKILELLKTGFQLSMWKEIFLIAAHMSEEHIEKIGAIAAKLSSNEADNLKKSAADLGFEQSLATLLGSMK